MTEPARAVVDTSSLVGYALRRDLQQAAQIGSFEAFWSPWIIAELNRVLVWRWIKDRTGNDLSRANERACGESAKAMMALLLPVFDLVTPLPPYPAPWETLMDEWDHPIYAAAVASQAHYVISENTLDYPPRNANGFHVYNGIEYLPGQRFLDRIYGDEE
ncbi:MAG: PIN domain-containing protein [Chloroflexota bacterium]|nr:PIN domain-containing protein [Chloroflexota bacterium]